MTQRKTPVAGRPERPANIEIRATDIATGHTAGAGDHFVPPNR
jgi:hypothetical protein